MADPKNDIKSKTEETARIVEDALRSISSQVSDIFQDALSGTDKFAKSLTNDLQKGINQLGKSVDLLEGNLSKLNSGTLKRSEIERQIEARTNKILTLERQIQIAIDNKVVGSKKANKELQKAITYNNEVKKQLEEQAKEADKINSKLSTTGGFLKGLSKIPILGDLAGSEKVLARIQKEAARRNENGELVATRGSVFKEGVKGMGSQLMENITSPMSLMTIGITALVKVIKFIIDAMFGASKLVAQFRRDFGISAKSAEEIRQRTYDISQNSKNLADTQGLIVITQAQIVKSLEQGNLALGVQMDLTSALGNAGEKLLVQSAILRDNFGLEEEAIAGVTQESIRTGEEIEKIAKSSLGNVSLIGQQKGLNLDNNKLLTIASKTAGSLRSSFKDNTAEIAKGVAQLQLMGMTLEDTKKISSGLLDFETSISNQISAELLTGKQFNLERARLLALNRDYVGVGKEIVKQGITSNYLNGLNEIQLEDQAKLFNLNSDELTDIVRKQEQYNTLSVRALQTGRQIYDVEHKGLAEIYQDLKKQGSTEEQIKTILGDKLYLEKQAEDAQTKFNKALEQAKGAFEKLVSSGVLDKLADGITKFVNLLSGGNINTSTQNRALDSSSNMSKADRTSELQKMVDEEAGTAKKIIFYTLGMVEDALTFDAFNMTDKIVNEYDARDKRASGAKSELKKMNIPVDDFTITTNPKDTLVMAGGTKLGGNEELIAAMNKQTAVLDQLLAKDTNFYVDYEKFQTAGSRRTYSI
jgi:hypothetical protein